jgi:hypothetical protein
VPQQFGHVSRIDPAAPLDGRGQRFGRLARRARFDDRVSVRRVNSAALRAVSASSS